MKKLLSKIICIVLVFSMVTAMSSTAFAAQFSKLESSTIGTADDIHLAKDSYNALSPEAKAIFDNALTKDAELLEFHKTYVDPSFKAPSVAQRAYSTYAVAADPMTVLSAQLAALSLPSAVLYSLKAMGAGMVAALADGPLPIGDILLAAATVSAAIVIAANWNSISSKWTQIVAAFKKAFSDSISNVISAFSSIRSDVNAELAANPVVSVNGKEVVVNGVTYNCTTRADQLTQSQKQNKKYMPAVLYGGNVWVAASFNLSNAQALTIAACNSSQVGV